MNGSLASSLHNAAFLSPVFYVLQGICIKRFVLRNLGRPDFNLHAALLRGVPEILHSVLFLVGRACELTGFLFTRRAHFNA
jgi:hypothetical protein